MSASCSSRQLTTMASSISNFETASRSASSSTVAAAGGRCALHRCETFVGRTTNWLYDHLRFVPDYESMVLCDELAHREEFPLLEARRVQRDSLARRVWRRVAGARPFPSDARWLRRARPSVLHSHFGDVAVEDFALRAYLGVPWIVSFYGADAYQSEPVPGWREKYDRLFVDATLVLALGPRMAARLEAAGCPREKLVVHHLGVDVDGLPTRPRVLDRGETLRILFAGTFREKKGVEYVIRGAAAARACGVPIEVTLVGDAGGKQGDVETKKAIYREIERLSLGDVVTHRPYVPFGGLVELALSSHVFVAPSVTAADGDAEGTPFVLQQMMATGMPVIATTHSDIPFLFGQDADRLVPERDADAIARRLVEYADDPTQLVVDGTAMRNRVQTALDVRDRATQLSRIYDQVLSA